MRWKRARLWASIFGTVLFTGLIALAVNVREQKEVDRRVQVRLANAEALIEPAQAQHLEVESLRARAFAHFDAAQADEGEVIWQKALAIGAAQTASVAMARRELEAALAIDATRRDVREALVATEMLRAKIADRDHAEDVVEDALARLQEWNVSSASLAQWGAPAKLHITTRPSQAKVAIARYVKRSSGRWPLEEKRALGKTPIEELMLAPGSYLITLEAAGFETVSYPIMLARSEARAIDVPMLREESVPNGFAYVPAGAFITGVALDDQLRRTLYVAAPLHRAHTGPFLIAKHETTYAEWIAFLEAMRATSFGGPWPHGLRKKGPNQWELGFNDGGTFRSVRSDQRLVIADGAPELDWLELPVDRVLASDVAEYVAWLDKTGRVPRARACRELEWERAARGADDRLYPHGNALEPDDANFFPTDPKDARLVTRHPVGSHPRARSPFGVDDLAGNVFELVASPRASGIVIRGGAFLNADIFNAAPMRFLESATVRLSQVGVRVCADLP